MFVVIMLQIAWAVSMSYDYAIGPLNPIEFNVVEINFGNAWQSFKNVVVIPPMGDGIYYVHLLIAACHDKGTSVTLKLNGHALFGISHKIVSDWQASVREQAIIVKLNAGNNLYATMPESYCIYGSTGKQSAFNGFRLA